MKARDTFATADGFVDLTVYVGTPRFTLTHCVGDSRTVQECMAPDFLLSGRVAVDGQGDVYALLCGMQTSHWLMRNQEPEPVLAIPQGGRGSCALYSRSVGVDVYAQGPHLDDGTAMFTVYWTPLTAPPVSVFRAKYGSEGILQVIGPMNIVSTADIQRSGPWDLHWWNAFETQGFRAGQINRIPPGGDNNGTYGLMYPDGRVCIAQLTPGWNGYTNAAGYLAVRNGVPRLALQDPDPNTHTPDPDELQWLQLDAQGQVPGQTVPQPPPQEPPSAPPGGEQTPKVPDTTPPALEPPTAPPAPSKPLPDPVIVLQHTLRNVPNVLGLGRVKQGIISEFRKNWEREVKAAS